MNRFVFVAIVISLAVSNAHSDPDSSKPKMKVVDRSWSFFKTIPCEKLDNIKTYSEAEAVLLKRRRENCLKAVSAFLPKPIDN